MYSGLSPWTEAVGKRFARDLRCGDGPRGISQETRLQEDTRAGRQGRQDEDEGTLLLCPEAPREPAALRPPAGTRRRPPLLGRAQRTVAQPNRQAARDARRGSPDRLRGLRRRHS